MLPLATLGVGTNTFGTRHSQVVREEREAVAGTEGDSPEKEERIGAIADGGAPSGIEISWSEGDGVLEMSN